MKRSSETGEAVPRNILPSHLHSVVGKDGMGFPLGPCMNDAGGLS